MNTEKQNIEELQKAMHGAIDALFALRDAADKLKKKEPRNPPFAKGIDGKSNGEYVKAGESQCHLPDAHRYYMVPDFRFSFNARTVANRTNQCIVSHEYRKHPHRDVYYKIIPDTDIVCEAVDAVQGVIWHYTPDYSYKGVHDFEVVLPEVYYAKVSYVEGIIARRKKNKSFGAPSIPCPKSGIVESDPNGKLDIHSSGCDTGKEFEPDPHDFLANIATAKTCKSTAEQLAKQAKQEVHALKNLAVLEGDETADKKAGRIYDLIDQIVVCGVSEKRYGNSCIPDHNAQHIDLAELTEIAQLRKENAELKEWCDKLNECCNLLESDVQMLKAKIYDIQNKEK